MGNQNVGLSAEFSFSGPCVSEITTSSSSLAGVDSGDARDPSCHRIDSGDVKSTFFPSIIAIAA